MRVCERESESVCVLPAGVFHAARTSVFGLFNRTNVTAEEVISNLK